MSPFSVLKVSGERVAQVHTATEHEPVLQTPDKRDDVPVQVIEYLNYKEEITLHNGILFKSQRIIIPKG